jgi:hypothetical protein
LPLTGFAFARGFHEKRFFSGANNCKQLQTTTRQGKDAGGFGQPDNFLLRSVFTKTFFRR